jgi:phosphoenolpyruvate carboxykinase (GTP)
VNWFRKDTDGQFLWPGFQQNMRILKWIAERAKGHAIGRETPIGWMPNYEDIEWTGLDFPKETFDQLQAFDRVAWRAELVSHEELFIDLHDHLPREIICERELLICRL